MKGLFIQFNCSTCNSLESAPTYKEITQCAKCANFSIPPKLLSSGQSKFAKRTCLCRFCHSVYVRKKYESGFACFLCRVFLRANGEKGDFYDQIWCKLKTSRCYVCKDNPVRLKISGKANVCSRYECYVSFRKKCTMTIMICLKRCGFYRDLREKIYSLT